MKKRVKLIHTKLLEVISGKYQYFHPFIHYKVEKSDLWFFQTFGSFSTRRHWQKVFTKYLRLDQEILWKMFIHKSRPVQASLRSLSQVEWEVQTRFKHAEGCFNQNSSWTWKLQWFHNRKLISRKFTKIFQIFRENEMPFKFISERGIWHTFWIHHWKNWWTSFCSNACLFRKPHGCHWYDHSQK